MHEQGLIQAINQCELIDSGFVGDSFTWERDGTKKCLDRMLVNISWRLRFTEVEVHHLPFFKSDHRHLLVKFENHPSSNRHRRPFRFEAAWLTHQDCNRVIKDAWDPHLSCFPHQLHGVQEALQTWNKNTFGHIFKRKKALNLLSLTERSLEGDLNNLSWSKRRFGINMQMCLPKRRSFGIKNPRRNG